MNIFLDIETIPAEESDKKSALDLVLKKKQRYGKEVDLGKENMEQLYRDTAVSGDFGRIFCIGYALEDGQVQIIYGEEKKILEEWWKVAAKGDCFIGHNIMEFDLRFIYKRSIVNRIKPSAKHLNLSFARYRNFPIFDTMKEWEKWSNSYIALDALAKILQLPSSKDGGIKGSQVFDFFLAGKYKEIYEYCKRDVQLTRQVYNRMLFKDK
ncbi:MAG: hypothetical protein A3H50_02290 [Candidatus Levybacteria bacterium RIFCSPLOWO2_02_FULL_37_10]|nr:MAG: hypothetical protein A2860_00340 [Candidatus Levybacteria bacterium RIFCSPHIGHO2_01_FULL_37_33]OGH17117.1 MAG: hypothetical protein A3C97_00720 [Candidatus Levybacteria bacterium RIFCSPHIGHO2_02_FULL_37_11]OGH32899.1 MAG: hypothetical protein A2953_02035 [Candidatus Levybacteria bacterium RIFCSPLOWO2_01_FULL_36_54]OGH44008.1 MAG: hypothetical protein A3H50_02290 [Candidatus Levybacteria bacterium RIFCSPLOWO2_02_FULL_37_10]